MSDLQLTGDLRDSPRTGSIDLKVTQKSSRPTAATQVALSCRDILMEAILPERRDVMVALIQFHADVWHPCLP